MAKIFIKMIALVGVLLAVPYYMMGGAVPDFLSGFSGSSVPTPTGVSGIGNAVTDKDVTVYQWVDEKGVKHYSNTPPAGQQAETLHLRSDTNLIKAIEPPAEKKPSRPKVTSIGGGMTNPYSPGGAKKLMDDAKNVQELLNQRFERQQEILNQP